MTPIDQNNQNGGSNGGQKGGLQNGGLQNDGLQNNGMISLQIFVGIPGHCPEVKKKLFS